jgi:predicted enzyme related to lactoylglutathione lyase
MTPEKDEQRVLVRNQAIAAFNRAWELIEAVGRSQADDDEMLAAAFASRYLWEAVGSDEQRALGDWQIAHVASRLGYADLALDRSARALKRVQENGWTDWRLASAYEGMARAHATAGSLADYEHWAELAREVLDSLTDNDDREIVGSQLASIEAPGSRGAGQLGTTRYRVISLDHVQLAMPKDREVEAEAFYGAIFGLGVKTKPAALATRGGRWFENGEVKVHLGVEASFRPAEKAHPALVVEGLDALVEALENAGHTVVWNSELVGVRRCHVADPFGNRLELIEA